MNNTLFHAPLACSLAVRMAAAEGGVPLDIAYLNLKTKELEGGGSLFDVNPLGQVSVIKDCNGQIITETSTCLQWVQLNSKDASFYREPSSSEFLQISRWISFCSTELHKQIFRVVFYDEATADVKERFLNLAPARLDLLNKHLADKEYLVGNSFSSADAYLTWFFVLSSSSGVEVSPYENLVNYRDRMFGRADIKSVILDDQHKDVEIGQNLMAG
ncbi:glutathione S-transferase family protein [Pseudoteredinibacter isoporae]|uniref:Glutathione S-transferase n=1 Tax=Pseudoteredinibacter isoporae TaxID=570281 RepID=A0A7X0MWI4_9GAMM|nr:glutathione binding-like protein [Pseudoteredinibacter isoporae]MBB6522513.1 glutathione S-transferase [Pseudoteredinibacter isoporae]NHO88042.1 hypothetical protein [Pseudoteredinibacter isoporae]NIB23627.1 hypothetical protein [Pseudoteredinibacter isoporae]